MLADMATEIEAARALIYHTARMIDSGAKNYAKESAMCKYFASDIAMKVTTDAVQLLIRIYERISCRKNDERC
jgi:alkylation response protein AidB-like acyl-CoA dehydrogenase